MVRTCALEDSSSRCEWNLGGRENRMRRSCSISEREADGDEFDVASVPFASAFYVIVEASGVIDVAKDKKVWKFVSIHQYLLRPKVTSQ